MSKRRAPDIELGALSPKRQQMDALDAPCMIKPCNSRLTSSSILTDLDLEDHDDDFTTAQTPNSAASADSPITVATTPRAKFPSDLKTLSCTWPGCTKTFNRPARLRDHLNSHTNSRPFKCTYEGCNKDYIEDKHLKQHIKAAHKNERNHVCPRPGCGKSFVTGTRLKRHQAVHEGEDRFRCENCGQSFRKKETLNKHVRKEHLGLSPFQCNEPGCTEAFDSKGALRRHQDKIHGEIKYWCGECGLKTLPDGSEHRVGFTTEPLLQVHIKKEHQNCMFCDFKSSSQAELMAHVDRVHSGKTVQDRKTVLCPYDNCTKAFTKKSNLNAHIRSAHEGHRFICGQVDITAPGFESWTNDQGCGGKFSTKIRLEDHIRFVHFRQERPRAVVKSPAPVDFLADVAGLGGLERDIACPSCDAMFTRYHDLNLHIADVHDSVAADDFMPEQPFGDATFAEGQLPTSPWNDAAPDTEIFAAQMDYGPEPDEWLHDEADIMLLARDSPLDAAVVDPTLHSA